MILPAVITRMKECIYLTGFQIHPGKIGALINIAIEARPCEIIRVLSP
jgi:hypothetical protein